MKVILKIALLTLALSSCNSEPVEDICKYQGREVVDRSAGFINKSIQVRLDSTISDEIYILTHDWLRLERGDFIDCSVKGKIK